MAKFDLTIMNPPYDRNLHLKILEQVVPLSLVTINISPTGYLHDLPSVRGIKERSTLSQYKSSVAEHIYKHSHVSQEMANDMFDIGSFVPVDITCYDNKVHDDYLHVWESSEWKLSEVFNKVIVDYVKNKGESIWAHSDIEPGEHSIKLSGIHGHPGKCDEYDIMTHDIKIASDRDSNLNYVSFSTEEEKENFFNSLQTDFMRYVNYMTRNGVHIAYNLLPYMYDYLNPWTDERFFSYFVLSQEAQDTIHEFARAIDARK